MGMWGAGGAKRRSRLRDDYSTAAVADSHDPSQNLRRDQWRSGAGAVSDSSQSRELQLRNEITVIMQPFKTRSPSIGSNFFLKRRTIRLPSFHRPLNLPGSQVCSVFSFSASMDTNAEKCPALYVRRSGEAWHWEGQHSRGKYTPPNGMGDKASPLMSLSTVSATTMIGRLEVKRGSKLTVRHDPKKHK